MDTGSFYSVIPLKFCDNATLKPSSVKLIAANGSEIPVAGEKYVSFVADGVRLKAFVLVSEAIDEFLLGSAWLCENRSVWDFDKLTLNVNGREIRLAHKRPSTCVRRVIATDNVLIEARSSCLVPVRLTYASWRTPKAN